jgi:hypothetical protein
MTAKITDLARYRAANTPAVRCGVAWWRMVAAWTALFWRGRC